MEMEWFPDPTWIVAAVVAAVITSSNLGE